MISPQWALFSGIILSFFVDKNYSLKQHSKFWSGHILKWSIILLGASLNFTLVINQSGRGVFITFLGILTVIILGFLGIKYLEIDKKLGTLITIGTAICGGSAMAAIAPIIGAEATIFSMAMAIIFLLNALAVFFFPGIGHVLQLNQFEFGSWSALAIHDTSSVVAASSLYGKEALKIATTLKLIRAIWIIPISLILSFFWKNDKKEIQIPWFIFGFLFISFLFSFLPVLNEYKSILLMISKNGFAITLFLLGLSFDFKRIKEVGIKSFIFAIILWIIVSVSSLYLVRNYI